MLVFSKTFLCPQKWSQWGTEQKAVVFLPSRAFLWGSREKTWLCCFTSICKKSELGCFSDYYKEIRVSNQRSFLLCFSLGHIDLCWWWSSLLSLWAFQFSVPSMFCSWPLSVFPPPLLWCYFLLHAEVTTASLFLDCVRGDLSYLQQGRVVATKELWQVTPSAAAWVPSCCHPLLEGEKLQNLTLSLVSLWRRLLLQYEICASRCCENSPWSFLRLNISRRFP